MGTLEAKVKIGSINKEREYKNNKMEILEWKNITEVRKKITGETQ